MSSATSAGGPTGRTNDDFPWDEFDSAWYADHNYKVLREDDREFLEVMRDFFSTADGPRLRRGLDVGTGSNLYPALSMLPLCKEITLWERSASNVGWLKAELVPPYSTFWDPYWDVLAARPTFGQIRNPRARLALRAKVRKANIFDLPRGRWDIGTMFFVAESISTQLREFKLATHRFVRALKAGSPFAAAFMRNSRGYTVGGRTFPAVAVDEGDVDACLTGFARDVKITTIKQAHPDRREGYDGMILAIGKAA